MTGTRSEFEIMNELYPEDTIAGVALASAARTASVNSSQLRKPKWARGVKVFINCTVDPAAASVVFTIAEAGPIATTTYSTLLVSAAIAGVGQTVLTIYPGVTPANNVALSAPLGDLWRVQAVAADADSITYSVGFTYLP